MNCGDLDPLLHAYVDGEFTADDALVVEAHAQDCPDCRERIFRERRDRATLRAHLRATRAVAPAAVHAAIETAIQRERRRATAAQLARWGSLTLAVATVTTVAWSMRSKAEDPIRSAAALGQTQATSAASVETWFDGKMRHPVRRPKLSNVKLAGAGPAQRVRLLGVGKGSDAPLPHSTTLPVEVGSRGVYSGATWERRGHMYELVTDLDEAEMGPMVGALPSSPYFIQPASLSGP